MPLHASENNSKKATISLVKDQLTKLHLNWHSAVSLTFLSRGLHLTTVEPQFNEGPGLDESRFFSTYFPITGAMSIVRYKEDFAI